MTAGCARCGNGDRPGHMVVVGDERLCVTCAGTEIGRLLECLASVEELNDSLRQILVNEGWDIVKLEHYAALGKEQS